MNMISRQNTVNLSNMAVTSEEVYSTPKAEPSGTVSALTKWLSGLTFGEEKERWKITRFAATPPMSTYILAWANGPFEHLESSYTSPLSGKTKALRIYGPFWQFRFVVCSTANARNSYEGLHQAGAVCVGRKSSRRAYPKLVSSFDDVVDRPCRSMSDCSISSTHCPSLTL
jgi:hypothetical protein